MFDGAGSLHSGHEIAGIALNAVAYRGGGSGLTEASVALIIDEVGVQR